MRSFVDMMDDTVWTENDIINRTETMIRQYFSSDAENILIRKTSAAIMGQYQLTPEEQQEIHNYAAICAQAQNAGRQAREDMRLLKQAMDYEKAQHILETYRTQTLETVRAEETINTAPADVVSLVGERERHRKGQAGHEH